ncbi:elongation factor 2 [Fonsecaea nubica]|uniref:Elongation factor 2 n=1 Tax=Fonsecaea nubica TaxID=856822 RepID=A0A178DAW5_9EURO|nr:elongation factor 2 [Fonsecaea nubica]OAL39158.1 elongation factor 2 [Fonsecaea nubica]
MVTRTPEETEEINTETLDTASLDSQIERILKNHRVIHVCQGGERDGKDSDEVSGFATVTGFYRQRKDHLSDDSKRVLCVQRPIEAKDLKDREALDKMLTSEDIQSSLGFRLDEVLDLKQFFDGSEKEDQKEDQKKDPIRWVHLHENSLNSMMGVVQNICKWPSRKKDRQQRDMLSFFRKSWDESLIDGADVHYISPSCWNHQIKETVTPMPSQGEPIEETTDLLATYIPYITFGKPRPRGENTISKDISYSRTLDQYPYHAAPDTIESDYNQVVSRAVAYMLSDRGYSPNKAFNPVEYFKSPDILRVDQFCLWVIDERTIVTSSTAPPTEQDGKPSGRSDPLFATVLAKISKNCGWYPDRESPTPVTVNDCAGMITASYIDIFRNVELPVSGNDQSNDLLDVNIFQLFAHWIEEMRRRGDRLRNGFKSEFSEQAEQTKQEESQAGSNKVSTGDLEVVWTEFRNIPPKDESSTGKATKEDGLFHGPKYIIKHLRSLENLAAERAQVVQATLDLLLNKMQYEEAQESVKQGQESARQGRESARQGKTIMVFTYVTAVFFPLSFLTSLFSLNITTFPHNMDQLVYRPGWIFPKLFGISIGSTLFVLGIVYTPTILRILKAELEKKRSGQRKLDDLEAGPVKSTSITAGTTSSVRPRKQWPKGSGASGPS